MICSSTAAANKIFDGTCDAYLEGFLTGMRSAGVACPPEGTSTREVRRIVTGLPRAAIGDKNAAELLAPLILARYRCGEEKPSRT